MRPMNWVMMSITLSEVITNTRVHYATVHSCVHSCVHACCCIMYMDIFFTKACPGHTGFRTELSV